MPVPRGPHYPTFPGVRPSPPKGDPVLGVGSRVVVTGRGAGSGRVGLMDDSGTSTVATIAEGAEVEILAWRPRRGGETRYRVVPTNGGVEGWLGAASLQPRPPSPSPSPATPAPADRVASPARTAPGKAPRKLNSSSHSPKGSRRGTR
jgi:hypothetical protein